MRVRLNFFDLKALSRDERYNALEKLLEKKPKRVKGKLRRFLPDKKLPKLTDIRV